MGQTREIQSNRAMNAAEQADASSAMTKLAEAYLNGMNIRPLEVTGPASGLAATLRSRNPLIEAYLQRSLPKE